MKTKTISGMKVEDADEGKVSAIFSTFNVVDSDGDVTLPGAFTEGQKVRISAYNHASWGLGALPVGKGVVRTTDNEAIMDGEFFLDTVAGADTFKVVKQLEELGEWSYGYDIDEAEGGTFAGESVQILKRLTVHEVSPVILGAGVGTRTLAMKAKQLQSDVFQRLRDAGRERWGDEDVYVWCEDFDLDENTAVFDISAPDETRTVQVDINRSADGSVELGAEETEVQRTTDYTPKSRKGRKLSDQLSVVMVDVEAVTERLAAVSAKRSEKGKSLGQESTSLAVELESKCQRLREVLTSAAGTGVDLGLDVRLAKEAARFRL